MTSCRLLRLLKKGREDRRTDGTVDGRTDGQTNERTNGRKAGNQEEWQRRAERGGLATELPAGEPAFSDSLLECTKGAASCSVCQQGDVPDFLAGTDASAISLEDHTVPGEEVQQNVLFETRT